MGDDPGLSLSWTATGGEDGPVVEWTVAEGRVPEAIGFVPTMQCFPRRWQSPPPAWSAGGDMHPVRVESEAFAERFDARVAGDQDRNWLLQLLSPAFIAWLTDRPQEDFGFEVHEGHLRCFTPRRLEQEAAEPLEDEARAVLERIRAEALEAEGLGVRELGSGIPERIERAVGAVPFAATPADAREASRPFRSYAARDPRVYAAALGGVLGAYGLLLGLLFEIGGDAIDILVALVSWIGIKATGIALAVIGAIGYALALPEAISVAARRYGRVAFAREYARARHLELESPQSFHRRLLRVELPAPAQFVLRGALAGRREGRLALCRSRRGLLSNYFDAFVVASPGADAAGPDETAAPVRWSRRAGLLVLWRSSSADRSAASLDTFVTQAVDLAECLERDVDAQEGGVAADMPAATSTTSTSPSGS